MDEAQEIAIKPELKPAPVPPKGASFGWLLWFLLFLFVVYPLSLGPAARLHQKFPKARPAIEAVYQPLVALMEHSPTARAACMWYLSRIWKVED